MIKLKDILFEKFVNTELDQKYFDAIKRNDIEMAQQMTNDTAKKSGYNIGPLWHQTNKMFNVFDISNKHGSSGGKLEYLIPNGIYLKDTNKQILVRGDLQMKLFAKLNNPLQIEDRDELSNFLQKNMPEFSEIENTLEGIRKNGIEKLRKSKNLNIDAKNFQNEYNRFTQRIKAMVTLFFNKSKFDGIIINNDRNILTTVVFKANQLKSATPPSKYDITS
jgi:hypothetical protein